MTKSSPSKDVTKGDVKKRAPEVERPTLRLKLDPGPLVGTLVNTVLPNLHLDDDDAAWIVQQTSNLSASSGASDSDVIRKRAVDMAEKYAQRGTPQGAEQAQFIGVLLETLHATPSLQTFKMLPYYLSKYGAPMQMVFLANLLVSQLEVVP